MAEKKRRSLIDLLTGKSDEDNKEEPVQYIPMSSNPSDSSKKRKDDTVEVNDIVEKTAPISHIKSEAQSQEPMEGQLIVDVYQTNEHIIVRSTVAGVEPKDIDISLNNDILTIRGSRKPDINFQENNYYYREIFWGNFSRTIILPVEVDPEKTEASLKNGILTIKLPKKFEERYKKIQIKTE